MTAGGLFKSSKSAGLKKPRKGIQFIAGEIVVPSVFNTDDDTLVPLDFAISATIVGSRLYILGHLNRDNVPLKNPSRILVVDYAYKIWVPVDISGPYVRFHACVHYIDGLYLCGGEDLNSVVTNGDVYKLDLVTMEWNPCNTRGKRPPLLYFHTAELVECYHRMVIFGGLDHETEKACNDVWAVDLDASAFLELRVTGRVPPARYRHSSCSLRDLVFVWGGVDLMFDTVDSPPFNDLHVLRLSLLRARWSQPVIHGLLPRPLSKASMCAFQGHCLVLGGCDEDGKACSDCYAYSPQTQTWHVFHQTTKVRSVKAGNYVIQNKANKVPTVMSHASVAITSGILIIGGERPEEATFDLGTITIYQQEKS